MARYYRSLVLATVVGLLAHGSAQATNTALRKEMTEVAKKIKQLYDGQKLDAIAVGQFTGPSTLPSSAGPGIAQTLTEELQKAGMTVRKVAKYGIKGNYHGAEVEGANGKEMVVKLKAAVEDSFGKVLADYEFDLNIHGETAFAEMLGVTIQRTRKDSEVDVYKKLRENYAEPKTHTDTSKTKVLPSKDSPYSVEILVNGQSRPITNDDGLAMVQLHAGEVYTIRLHNKSKHEAAVRLSVDGLNIFTFSELRKGGAYGTVQQFTKGDAITYKSEPLMTHVLVPAGKHVDIRGWHVNNKQSDLFLVTTKGKGAADKLGHTSNLGTITAIFHAAWPKNGTPPDDEPPRSRDPHNVELRTGFGGRFEQTFRHEARDIGAIRASICVRYSKK